MGSHEKKAEIQLWLYVNIPPDLRKLLFELYLLHQKQWFK